MKNQIKQHIASFDAYHRGTINILLHDIGFALWGYAIARHSWFLIIVSPFVFESGHVYNYFRNIYREQTKQHVILQILTWLLFMGVGFLVIVLFG